MKCKTYYAIKTKDIDDSNEGCFSWDIICIKAFNYFEAKTKLKKLYKAMDDYYLIPAHTLKCRDTIKAKGE
jgi:hypothetical protein